MSTDDPLKVWFVRSSFILKSLQDVTASKVPAIGSFGGYFNYEPEYTIKDFKSSGGSFGVLDNFDIKSSCRYQEKITSYKFDIEDLLVENPLMNQLIRKQQTRIMELVTLNTDLIHEYTLTKRDFEETHWVGYHQCISQEDRYSTDVTKPFFYWVGGGRKTFDLPIEDNKDDFPDCVPYQTTTDPFEVIT